MRGDERAVSDLVAFSMIFMIVFASIGFIAFFGFDAVDHVREGEQTTSAQSAMITLADQLNGIADHEAPARSTEIRLGGATMTIDDGPLVNVTADYGDGNTVTWERHLGAITYRLGDQRIVVTGGAVIRADEESSVLIREPPFLCTDEHARLNLIRVEALEAPTISTDRSIQVRNHHQRTRLIAPVNRSWMYEAHNVTIEFKDTEYPDAWEQFFNEDDNWEPVDGNEFAYVCDGFADLEDGGIIIRDARIGIRYVR